MLKSIFDELHRIENELESDLFFYRGHSDSEWPLLPSFARRSTSSTIEAIAYYDFLTRAGNLLPIDESGWTHLFEMQHHGIPTRLLDWTTTFGVALFFAVHSGLGDGAIWVLNPFALNQASWTSNTLPAPKELESSYYETFITQEKKISAKIVAISPTRLSPRVFNQKSAFTLHIETKKPLERMYPDVVRKLTIPKGIKDEAKEFLKLAGITTFSLFPDLDGLAKDIVLEHFT